MWADPFYEIGRLNLFFPPTQDVLIIHLGGNDIGKGKTLDLILKNREDLHSVRLSLLNTEFFLRRCKDLKKVAISPCDGSLRKKKKKRVEKKG